MHAPHQCYHCNLPWFGTYQYLIEMPLAIFHKVHLVKHWWHQCHHQGCNVPLQPYNVVFLGVDDGLQLVDTVSQTPNNLKQHLPFRRCIVDLFLTVIVLLVQETQILPDHPDGVVKGLQISMDQGPFLHLPQHSQIHMDLGKCLLHLLLIGVEISFSAIILADYCQLPNHRGWWLHTFFSPNKI